MKKILYIMGIEWNWILQRPQILAFGLQEEFEVTIVTPKQLISREKNRNECPDNIRNLYQIPFQEKCKLVRVLSDLVNLAVFKDIYTYDLVWVGYPIYQRYIPEDYKGIVIYDCMDNFESLYPDRRERAIQYVLKMERELVLRSDIIFASSEKLAEKMRAYSEKANIVVVRNGAKNIKSLEIENARKKESYLLGYVGTIAEWFENKVLEQSLAGNDKISYMMIGPVTKGHKKIENEKVTYLGPVAHEKLAEKVRNIDCLIMPFLVNDIILYVDPVKLYEYISWGKCIVASYYPEVARFEPYVYFYHNEKEYVQLIDKLSLQGFPPKYNKEQQIQFLSQNTWDKRIQDIKKNIVKLLEN